MATIKLTGGSFALVPEGTHVFKITDVEYKESYGKMTVKMETADGYKHEERFSFLKANGETNEGALKAFSYFAKTALNNYSLEEIDHTELIGHYIRCEVTHTEPQPNRNDPSKTVQFVQLGEKSPADGFDTVPAQKPSTAPPATAPAPAPAKKTSGGFDLDSLLG